MQRSALVKTLELVSPAVADGDPVQMFQCYTFTGKHVLAYNDRLAIIAPCQTDESFAVNGKVLLGLLKNTHSDEVDFTKTDKNDITVKAGKSRFRLPYFPEEDFLFKEPDQVGVMEIKADDTLLPGLDACMITASRDLAQGALLGVILKPWGKTMAFYSCDGDAITRFAIAAKAVKDLEVRWPNEFCEAFSRTAKETETAYKQIRILGDEWVLAMFPNDIMVYGRLLKIENPLDHEEHITKTIKGEPLFKPVPKALDHALSRARVVADPESAKTELEVVDGKLLLHTDTHMGVINDTMVWREHPETKADVSAALIQRSIALCDEMGITDRCTIYRRQPNLFIVVSNMG